MKEVLILTGACGVGKSTIAQQWAKSKNGAAINCDHLTGWIHNTNFPKWTIEEEKFVAQLAAKIAIEYLKYGMPTSIEYVWSPAGIEILKTELQNQMSIDLKLVYLYCDRNENHKRDRLRVPENQMKERVDVVDAELKSYNWPSDLISLDSTNLTVDQTLEKINQLN